MFKADEKTIYAIRQSVTWMYRELESDLGDLTLGQAKRLDAGLQDFTKVVDRIERELKQK